MRNFRFEKYEPARIRPNYLIVRHLPTICPPISSVRLGVRGDESDPTSRHCECSDQLDVIIIIDNHCTITTQEKLMTEICTFRTSDDRITEQLVLKALMSESCAHLLLLLLHVALCIHRQILDALMPPTRTRSWGWPLTMHVLECEPRPGESPAHCC